MSHPVLSAMEAAMFATVLEHALQSIYILAECNSVLKKQKTMADLPSLQFAKYGIEYISKIEDDINYPLDSKENKLRKMDADKQYLLDMLIKTYTELSLHCRFSDLIKSLAEKENSLKRFQYLREKEANNKLRFRELKRMRRYQRNSLKATSYYITFQLNKLKTQIALHDEINAIDFRFVSNWQRARGEQHEIDLQNKTDYYLNKIKHYKIKSGYETKIHTEMELYNSIVIAETLEKIGEVMTKYEKDVEVIDLKLQIVRNNYLEMADKRERLEDIVTKHEKEIKDWLTFKKEREIVRRHHDTMVKSAVIVQAWWRGILLRQRLGPYRPIKHKKKKKYSRK